MSQVDESNEINLQEELRSNVESETQPSTIDEPSKEDDVKEVDGGETGVKEGDVKEADIGSAREAPVSDQESDDDAPPRPRRLRRVFDDDEDEGDEAKLFGASDEGVKKNSLFEDDDDEFGMTPSSRQIFDDEAGAASQGDDTDAEDEEDEGYAERQGMYEFEGEEETGLEYVTLPTGVPLPAPDPADDLWLLGLPLSVSMVPEVFDAEETAAKERAAEGSPAKRRSLAQALGTNKIRLREKEDGTLTSNARLIEFTDGSCALFIGTTVFEADARSEGQSVLIEGSQAPLYRIHGNISHRRIFKPPNVSAMNGRNIRIQPNKDKRTRLTTVQKGAESELRLKRHLEEMELRQMEQSSSERKSKRKRLTTLDASYLEGDDF